MPSSPTCSLVVICLKVQTSFPRPTGASSTFSRSSRKIREKATRLHRSLTYWRVIGAVREPPHKINARNLNPIKISVQNIISKRNKSPFLTDIFRFQPQEFRSPDDSQQQLGHPVRRYQRPKCMQEILETTHPTLPRCSTMRRCTQKARYKTDFPGDINLPLKFHVTRLNICKIRRRKKCSPSDCSCYHPE